MSLLSQGDVPIEEVSRLVGHSDIGTTENVYRHEPRPALQNSARAMDTYSATHGPAVRLAAAEEGRESGQNNGP